jgi:hypothetical protein
MKKIYAPLLVILFLFANLISFSQARQGTNSAAMLKDWSDPANIAGYTLFGFDLPCLVETFPYIESFDGTTFPPECWENVKISGPGTPGTWDRQTVGAHPACSPHSGAAMARFNSFDYGTGTKGFLATTKIAMTSDQYEVHFWMYRDNGYGTIADSVNVYYDTLPNPANATLLGTVHRYYGKSPAEITPNQWYEYVFSMPPGSSGNGYILFEGVSLYGNNMFIDDIKVKPIFPCPNGSTAEQEPCGTDLNGGCNMAAPAFEPIILGETKCGTAYSNTGFRDTDWYSFTLIQRMNVKLTANAEFSFLTGIFASPCPQGSFIVSTTGTAYSTASTNVTLDAGTYYAYISPSGLYNNECGHENEYWITLTGVSCFVESLPFKESFDEPMFAPPCWINLKTAGTVTPGTWDRQTAGIYPTCEPHSGAAMARFNSFDYPSGTTAILVTPKIAIPSDQYEIHFWMYRDNGYPSTADRVKIYYSTSQSTVGAILLGTVNRSYTLSPAVATANQWYEYIFTMPAGSSGNAYIVFEGISAYGNSMFIDDVKLKAIFTCPPGSTAELESCGQDLNGGCNMEPPAFESVTLGQTICGSAWSDGTTRDTDWFTFTLAETKEVTFTASAEFPVFIGFVASPCPAYSFIANNTGPGVPPVSLTSTLSAGTYYALVMPLDWSTLIACGGEEKYWAAIAGVSYSCFKPTNVTVPVLTPTGATVSWTAPIPAPGSGYEYEIRTSGSPGSPIGLAASGTTAAGVLSATIYGLNPSTNYYACVRSNCGGAGFSQWSIPCYFQTPFIAVNLYVQDSVQVGQYPCYDALQTITVAGEGMTFVVSSGSSVEMIAGLNIRYLQGTRVLPGGYMHGQIAPNGPFCVPSPSRMVSGVENGFSPVPEHSFFKIYPNPTTGNFTIEQEGEKTYRTLRVAVYGIRGDKVMTGEMTGETKHMFSISEIPAGLFFVQVVADGYVETIKLVKTR